MWRVCRVPSKRALRFGPSSHTRVDVGRGRTVLQPAVHRSADAWKRPLSPNSPTLLLSADLMENGAVGPPSQLSVMLRRRCAWATGTPPCRQLPGYASAGHGPAQGFCLARSRGGAQEPQQDPLRSCAGAPRAYALRLSPPLCAESWPPSAPILLGRSGLVPLFGSSHRGSGTGAAPGRGVATWPAVLGHVAREGGEVHVHLAASARGGPPA